MTRHRLTIKGDEGLQSRAAALLVQVASKYPCTIWIEQGSKRVNAKSIMEVLSSRLKKGDEFNLVASGDDEKVAAAAIEQLIATGKVD